MKPTPESLVSRLLIPTSLEETSRPFNRQQNTFVSRISTTITLKRFPEHSEMQAATEIQGHINKHVPKRVNKMEDNRKL